MKPISLEAAVKQSKSAYSRKMNGAHPILSSDMKSCFLKLREIVPTIPQGKKLSKTELLQHVIDYIFDLEVTLDSSSEECVDSQRRYDRKPLEESNFANVIHFNQNVQLLNENCQPPPANEIVS